ncbi:PspC domain-containing protein [Coriobacteriia bacterium Es71-Z0120]|uniref:PspC domain-containing protein n=1 Tax=Parvivirga hydrogeniphila TaxID=2939460 RepID=UPI002260E08B|nr:PspC domain-containing protein [Parvivirga hydrogeniphila]MCL4078221.1 PspC domain-containing protein [Parvivirga hydrogeniphila]
MAERLYRSRSDRMIAGVCGGLAEHFGWDPVLVRLAALALLFVTSGGMALAYLVMAAVVPEAPDDASSGEPQQPSAPPANAEDRAAAPASAPPATAPAVPSERSYRRGTTWAGVVLVALGVALLVARFVDVELWRFWPVLLILVGLRMVVRGVRS